MSTGLVRVKVTDLPPGQVDVNSLTPSQVRERAIKLAGYIGAANAELMALLHRVQENMEYRRWGYETMNEYVNGELRFSVRKAQEFIAIWRHLHVAHHVTVAEMNEIDWTKLRVVAQAISAGTVDGDAQVQALLEEAKTANRDQFAKRIRKKIKAAVKEPTIEMRLQFQVTCEELKTWEEAVAKIRATFGGQIRDKAPMGKVIEAMALMVLFNGDTYKPEQSLAQYIASLERAFPTRKIIAVDRSLSHVVDEIVARVRAELDPVPADLKK